MAKISPKLKLTLGNLQQLLLDIVDKAKAADLYVQISRLLLRTAEIQPVITPDMLELLTDRITKIENRVPALERSVQEIKTDWGLL